jgi:hypothetical protein
MEKVERQAQRHRGAHVRFFPQAGLQSEEALEQQSDPTQAAISFVSQFLTLEGNVVRCLASSRGLRWMSGAIKHNSNPSPVQNVNLWVALDGLIDQRNERVPMVQKQSGQ